MLMAGFSKTYRSSSLKYLPNALRAARTDLIGQPRADDPGDQSFLFLILSSNVTMSFPKLPNDIFSAYCNHLSLRLTATFQSHP